MKNLILVSILALFLSACNEEKNKDTVSTTEKTTTLKEPVYPIVDNRFEKLKQVTLDFLIKREDVLKKEKDCVKKSKNREEIKKCLAAANDERKLVGEEIKTKKKTNSEVKEERKEEVKEDKK